MFCPREASNFYESNTADVRRDLAGINYEAAANIQNDLKQYGKTNDAAAEQMASAFGDDQNANALRHMGEDFTEVATRDGISFAIVVVSQGRVK